jgi:hypothetical protein
MGLLYGRAGRLNTENTGFRPGQVVWYEWGGRHWHHLSGQIYLDKQIIREFGRRVLDLMAEDDAMKHDSGLPASDGATHSQHAVPDEAPAATPEHLLCGVPATAGQLLAVALSLLVMAAGLSGSGRRRAA